MARPFALEVVTPERVVFSGEVTALTAPGSEGSYGVLANHHPMITGLTTGEVKIVEAAGRERHMVITGGFFEVSDNSAIVLADTAEWAEEIDVPRAQRAYERARERLVALVGGAADRERARRARARARLRLAVARKAGEGPH